MAKMSGPRLSASHKSHSSRLALRTFELGGPDRRAYHVLLGDEALNVAVGEGLLEGLGESRVLGVSVEGHHSLAGLAEFGQRHAIRTPCCHLKERK